MPSVLHLIDTGGPGGAETVFANLVSRLDSSRWRPIAVVPYHGWLSETLAAAGVRAEVVSTDGSFDWRYVARVSALLRRHRVALIQSHLFGPAVYGSLAARLTRIPLVATFHGWADIAPDERFLSWKLRILRRSSNRLVFVSAALRERFRAAGYLRGTASAVIPNGIEMAAFQPRTDTRLRAELGIAADEFVIGTVGNIRPAKGYEILLQAAAILKGRGEACRFVIVGEGSGALLQELEQQQAQLGLDGTAIFAGFRSDVSQAMANFDLHVLASHSEGFSLSTVQALACGVPVVATRCGGPEDILRDGVTGVLVDRARPDLLADAIQRLCHEPETRHALAHAGRADVLQRFELARMIGSYEQLYEESLRSSGNGMRSARR